MICLILLAFYLIVSWIVLVSLTEGEFITQVTRHTQTSVIDVLSAEKWVTRSFVKCIVCFRVGNKHESVSYCVYR